MQDSRAWITRHFCAGGGFFVALLLEELPVLCAVICAKGLVLTFLKPCGFCADFRRRLVKRIYIPLPDPEGRRTLLMHALEGGSSRLTRADVERVVQSTSGRTILSLEGRTILSLESQIVFLQVTSHSCRSFSSNSSPGFIFFWILLDTSLWLQCFAVLTVTECGPRQMQQVSLSKDLKSVR